MSFITELKRRNVFRVGIAYLVGAWLLLQLTEVLSELLNLPEQVGPVVVTAVVIGLPIVLIAAWVYELTPQGIKRESEIDHSASTSPRTGRRLNGLITVLLTLAVGYLLLDKFYLQSRQSPEIAPPVEAETVTSKDPKAVSVTGTSIAVLPFVNMSEESGNEYFADGLSEELLNLLAQLPELRVAARTSSFSFKGKDATVSEIGDQLGVQHVLEGSVRKAGDQVRITAQLIDTEDGFHLWSESYDRTLEDIFAVQDEIAAAVVDALRLKLPGMPLPERQTVTEAYTLYLEGLYFFNQLTPEGLANAVEKFQAVLALDPDYVPALTQLANAFVRQSNNGTRPFDSGFELGRQMVRRAIEIDPSYATAWGGLGYIQAYYDWDWEDAAHSIARMMELDSGGAFNLHLAATFANMQGRFKRSLELRARAIERDPLQATFRVSKAYTLMTVGRHQDAVDTLREALELFPDFYPARRLLGKALLLDRQPDAALELLDKTGFSAAQATWRAMALHSLGKESEALEAMQQMRGDSTTSYDYYQAQFHAWRGDHETALDYLERATEARWRQLAYVLGEPILFPLHDDPRWEPLLERIGLLEAWRQVPPEYGGPSV